MRDNILLITTDQQRFDTINALGNKHIYTPHLNWLVDRGITFNRCYSDSPVCMPARATIMTGKHAYTHKLMTNSAKVTPLADNVTLPELLTQNGYQTRAQGKMHFQPMRANYGFEHMELPMDYYRECNRNQDQGIPKGHGVGENEIDPVISTVPETKSLTYWTVNRSIDFIETKDPTRPFFLWTSFTKPHPPLDPCFNYWALYQNKDLPDPVYGDWSQTPEDVPAGFMHSTHILNNAYRFTAEQMRDVKRAYYACITQIDYTLGLLFARLRELDLLKNTWIIFTSDHGDMLGDHHMGAKSNFFEGSAHVPLLVCPPDRPDTDKFYGTKCDKLVSLADIMPTILNIAQIESPKDIDGKNLLEITQAPTVERDFFGVCSHYHTYIQGDYKYIWTALDGVEMLFNLSSDPFEQHNLAIAPEYCDILTKLRDKMITKLEEQGSKWVVDGKLHFDEGYIKAPKSTHKKWPGFHSTIVNSDVLH